MSKPESETRPRAVPRIFQLNEFDWWAASDLESAMAAYRKDHIDMQCNPEAALLAETDDIFDEPHALSDSEMLRLKFQYDEDEPRAASFRERLNELIREHEEFPCFFATTEI